MDIESRKAVGVAVPGGFRNAGASLLAVAPFPVAALRTQRADFRTRLSSGIMRLAHGTP